MKHSPSHDFLVCSVVVQWLSPEQEPTEDVPAVICFQCACSAQLRHLVTTCPESFCIAPLKVTAKTCRLPCRSNSVLRPHLPAKHNFYYYFWGVFFSCFFFDNIKITFFNCSCTFIWVHATAHLQSSNIRQSHVTGVSQFPVHPKPFVL